MAERGYPKPVGDGQQEFTFRNVQLLKNETLGTGSYGAVCKAKCDQLICAAKLLYQVLFQLQAPDPGKEHRQPFRRFEQECQFLSRVNHPNIVQYLGTYRDPETNAPVLLMELMDESLTHFLESSLGDIPYHIQVNLSQDIAQALAFLHANGIIHRDLSSNNVLLIAGSRAKVSDFGMSKFSTTRLATMTTCPGTPAFMSPEALDEPPVYTEKLDTFSFGVLLVQINTRLFPEPTDRFRKIEMPDPRNPSHMFNLFAKIPEVERRQAHISLIEPTHPILPIALECLKDEAVERPSSEQLCQSLDVLKITDKYQESLQQDIFHILQEEVQEKTRQIQNKNLDIQNLQHELESKEDHLRRLNRQLESNEQITATLQHTITQRDREIAELKQSIVSKHEETGQSRPEERHTAASEEQLSMSWEILSPDTAASFCESAAAVIGDKVYFKMSQFIFEFTFTTSHWNQLPDHSLSDFSLVNVEDELTTVGGCNENWQGNFKHSNKLFSYIGRKWVEKYPPMPTKRYGCAAVYTRNALIVAGGTHGGSIAFSEHFGGSSLKTVEILDLQHNRWSKVSLLPLPTAQPSMAICGEHIYLYDTEALPHTEHSMVRCTVLSLALSTPKPVIWDEVASLPVKGSTLVTVKGHLLAVGGESPERVRSKELRQYNCDTNSWQVVSEMHYARYHCAAVFLVCNKLMIVGGTEHLT